jgi:hypothetical protein
VWIEQTEMERSSMLENARRLTLSLIAAALGALSPVDADSNRRLREATKRDRQVFAVSGAATQPTRDGIFPQTAGDERLR